MVLKLRGVKRLLAIVFVLLWAHGLLANIFSTVTDLATQGAKFAHDDVVFVKGLSAVGDGGAAYYRLDTSGTLGAGAADGRYVVATNGVSNSYFRLMELTNTAGLFLSAPTTASTTITDAALADRAKAGDWIVVDCYTTGAEKRLVTSVSGSTITVNRAFATTHDIADAVILTGEAPRNVLHWGAVGDNSTNCSPAVQAAIDDFDLTKTSSIRKHANHLFFPPGEYIFDSMIRLPVFTTYSTSRQTITGQNATLVTDSFNGPLFSTRWTGTHDGSENSTNVLSDSTASWEVDELVGGYAFNTTDGTSGTISTNTATTVTMTVQPGEPNVDWDSSVPDAYIITVPSSKWNFTNLHFRDDTAGFGTPGNAFCFDWSLYRMTIHNCSFSLWDAVIKSEDATNDLRQYIQSPRITGNYFDSCDNVVKVSKAWDFLFGDNLTDSCQNVVVADDTSSAAMIQGTVRNNTFQGSGNGKILHIRGGHGVTILNNYFESNNTGGEPYIDMVGGQQPRGLVISGNHIQIHDNDKDNASYFPIAINPLAEAVTIFGNQSAASLIDVNSQTIATGERWRIWGNHALFGEKHNGTDNLITRGTRVMRKVGQIQTTDATATKLDFGGGNLGTAGAMLYAAEAPFASAFHCEVKITGHNATTPTETASYWLHVVYEQGLGTGQFTQVNSTTVVASHEDDATWNATFSVVTGDDDLSSVNDTADTLDTSVAHGLTTDDVIYFTGTLPAPLVANKMYFAEVVDTDTLKVRRGIGLTGSVIDLTNTTLIGAKVRKEEVHVEVTGDGTDTVNWSAEATVMINRP